MKRKKRNPSGKEKSEWDFDENSEGWSWSNSPVEYLASITQTDKGFEATVERDEPRTLEFKSHSSLKKAKEWAEKTVYGLIDAAEAEERFEQKRIDDFIDTKRRLVVQAEKAFLKLCKTRGYHGATAPFRGLGGDSHYFVAFEKTRSLEEALSDERHKTSDDEIKFRVSDHQAVYHADFDFVYRKSRDYDKETLASLKEKLVDMLKTAKRVLKKKKVSKNPKKNASRTSKKKNPKQADEIILWATRKGDEDWQEELITAAPNTPEGREKIKKARAWAESQGFDRFRQSGFTTGEMPDFTATVKKRKNALRSRRTAMKRRNPSSSSPRVYVGTYAKYNEGSIKGKWLDLSDYASYEDFIKAAEKVHADERDPELMFQDFEGFPKAYYGESHIKPELWDWIALSDDEKEVFEAYQDAVGAEYATIDEAQDKWIGVADSKEDWAFDYIQDMGGLDPEGAQNYIYVDDVTARTIGIEEADSRLENMSDEEIVEQAGVEDEYEEALEADESGKKAKKIVDEARDNLDSEIADEVEEKVKDDPVGYFVDELGAYSVADLTRADFVSFDYQKYVRDVEMSGDVVFGEAGGKVYAFSGH